MTMNTATKLTTNMMLTTTTPMLTTAKMVQTTSNVLTTTKMLTTTSKTPENAIQKQKQWMCFCIERKQQKLNYPS